MSMLILCTGSPVNPLEGNYSSAEFDRAFRRMVDSAAAPPAERKISPGGRTVYIAEGELARSTAEQILEQDQSSWEEQKEDTLRKMKTYEKGLRREITMEDIDRLVDKPVRKISKFDVKAVDERIRAIEEEMKKVQDDIDHIDRYTINWFKSLMKKYGKDYPRRTELTGFETIASATTAENSSATVPTCRRSS